MADMRSQIFNQRATEKLRNPDDLDKYVRVTNPSVWVLLFACICLVLGMLAWGVFGTVSTSIVDTGVRVEGDLVVCFMDSSVVSKVHVGDVANVAGERMKVGNVAATPLSRKEIRELLNNDYLVSELVDGDWAYVVEIVGENDFPMGIPLDINITTERIAPISLVLG